MIYLQSYEEMIEMVQWLLTMKEKEKVYDT